MHHIAAPQVKVFVAMGECELLSARHGAKRDVMKESCHLPLILESRPMRRREVSAL